MNRMGHARHGSAAGLVIADNGGLSIDIRVVAFTLAEGELLVVSSRGGIPPELPRAVPLRTETIDITARRIVREQLGIPEQYIEQLYTLSVAGTGDRWTIIVAYLALIRTTPGSEVPEELTWVPATTAPLQSEADRVVTEYAVTRLRAKLGYTNIAFHLLPAAFTLSELQQAYEVILNRRLDKRNFRRRMIASGILEPTEQKRRDGSHRPAVLYRSRANLDTTSYLTPPWSDSDSGAPTT